MRFSWQLLFTIACCLFSYVYAASGPLVAKAGGVRDIKITKDNTVNATTTLSAPRIWQLNHASAAGQLNLSVTNNLPSNNVNVYITGLNADGLLVMLAPNGNWYYLPATNASVPQPVKANVAIPLGPQGSVTNITLPGYLSAGRIWFADGELQFFTVNGGNGPALVEPSAVNPSDPSAEVNWGFVELTWGAGIGIYANISYVDFVGLPLGMKLVNAAGFIQSANGVAAGAVASICNELIEQAKDDGMPWDQMCMVDSNGNPLRVLSPTQYLAINSQGFKSYWSNYIDQVWNWYTTHNLTINTQAAPGLVNCSVPVNGTQLFCAGDNRGYNKPTPEDIFGCNGGPFAIQGGDNGVHYAVVPRLCAAFHRTTLMMNGGNMQPGLSSASFYQNYPTNHYSRIVHEYEVDGKGYAFAYDDVTSDGAVNESGLLADANPVLLAVTVGGPLCSGSGCGSHAVSPALPSSSSISSSSTSTSSSATTLATSTKPSSTLSSTTKSLKTTSSSSTSTKSTTSTTKTSSTKSSTTKSKKQKSTATKLPNKPVVKTSSTSTSTSSKSTSTSTSTTKTKAAKTPKTRSTSSTSTTSSITTTSTKSTTSSTPLSCPSSNNTLFTSSSSIFRITCFSDHYGGDMGFASTPTLESCIALCVSTAGCIDVSYEISQGVCYMKNVLNAVKESATVWGAVYVGPASSSSGSGSGKTTPAPNAGTVTKKVDEAASTSASASGGNGKVKKVKITTTVTKTKKVRGTLTTVTRTKTIKRRKVKRTELAFVA